MIPETTSPMNQTCVAQHSVVITILLTMAECYIKVDTCMVVTTIEDISGVLKSESASPMDLCATTMSVLPRLRLATEVK